MEFSLGPNSGPVKKSGGIGATIFLILFSLPFAGFGIFAFVEGVKKLSAGDTKNGFGLGAFGLVFSLVGFGLMAAAIFGGKKARQNEELKQRYADRLWLVRPEWATGKIKSTATAQSWIYLLFGVVFGGMGAAFTVAMLPQELARHHYPALFVLLFPLIGFGFLIAFVRARLAHRRFGDCYFELAQIPAPLGGTLEGQISVGTRLRLEHGLHLKLSCLRRITTGSGKERHTQENILWQDEKIFRPEASLPEPEPGRSGIPVYFKLPADQPEATPDNGDGIHWRLEARAKMSGPNFSTVFEVPVFRVAGAVVAENEMDAADPTIALQESIEEVRREEGSKIQVTDGPAGREFYFPAARNLGAAVFVTAIFIVWSGFLWLMIVKKAPLLFPIVFGLFDVLLFFGVVMAWFKSSRVTVGSDGVTAVNRWLLFGRTRRFAAGDIAEIITQPGMQSGSQIYWAIKLVTRAAADSFAADKAKFQQTGQMPSLKLQIGEARRGTALASDVASKPEADWLAREMNKALGRKA
jgi:hypothetical protein